jgi:hypothetical protein
VIGVMAIPLINTMPSPLQLCSIRPPFECISARLTGAQFIADDGPVQIAWLTLSLIIAPAFSLAGAFVFERGRFGLGRILAAVGLVPNLVLLIGPQSVMPFQPVVVGLTLVTLIGLALARREGQPAGHLSGR